MDMMERVLPGQVNYLSTTLNLCPFIVMIGSLYDLQCCLVYNLGLSYLYLFIVKSNLSLDYET